MDHYVFYKHDESCGHYGLPKPQSSADQTGGPGRAEFSSGRATDIWFVTGPSDYAGRSGSGPIRNESTRELIRGFTSWNGSFLFYFIIYFLCFLIKYLF